MFIFWIEQITLEFCCVSFQFSQSEI
uniref:Uncharacterized protein n=1 Tax=Musa acuminata subsp. malaccensis TaxID=214687 RepID=A0A804I1C9_MUSAM